jgi:hypothetical protein
MRYFLGTFPRFALFVCTVYKMHICTILNNVHLCKMGQKLMKICTFAQQPLGCVHLCIHVQSVFVRRMALADRVASRIG